MRGLFIDTSAWLALVETRNPAQGRVTELLSAFPGTLYTSNFVFDEVVTLCLIRHGHAVAQALGTEILKSPELRLIRITAEDEERGFALFCQRGDEAYSFTDCTSFVLMRRLGLTEAATLDDDFEREGFSALP